MTTDVFGYAEPKVSAAPKKRVVTYHPTWGGYNNLPRVPGHEWRDYWPRVSSLAKLLDDEYNLTRHKLRKTVEGIAGTPVLLDLISDRYDADSKDGRDQLDFVANKAMELAGAHDPADKGTELHDFCEQADAGAADLSRLMYKAKGKPPRRITPDEVKVVEGYLRRIESSDFEIVPEYMERVLVCPDLECAGKTDRILRHKPSGKLIIGDLKSGKWELDKYGKQALSIQLACYANASHILNEDAWEWETPPVINKVTGLGVWIPQGQPGRCELYRVDLNRGYRSALRALEEKQDRKAKGVVTRIT